jgi:hypothetical protein
MAISSSTAPINLTRPIGSVQPSPHFLAVRSLQAAPLRRSPWRFRRLSAAIPRRSVTRVTIQFSTYELPAIPAIMSVAVL